MGSVWNQSIDRLISLEWSPFTRDVNNMAENLDLLQKCSISMFTNETCGYWSLLPKERKMVHVRSKTRSLGQILEKPCIRSTGHISSPIIMKLIRIFVLLKSRTSLKMGHVGSKTRSLGQILEKPCVRSRVHIFSQIIMKLDWNNCLDEISDQYENGLCRVKN